MKKAMVRTLLVLIPGPVLALTSIHLGNSLSAQCYDNFAYYARQKGKTLTTINAAGGFGAGMGLGLYSSQGVSVNRSGDVFIPQTFCNGSQLGLSAETRLVNTFYGQALAQNGNCELYIFNEYQWYKSTFAAFEKSWLTTAQFVDYSHGTYYSKRFHDSLLAAVRRANPGKKVYLLPVANVLYEAQRLVEAKQYPGISSGKEFYSALNNGVPDPNLPFSEGEIHFGPKGIYMQMCVQYTCLFKEKPHDGPIANFPLPNNGSLKFSVPQDFAKATWDLVWNFCVNNAAMTGVSGTPTRTVERFSVLPAGDRRQDPLSRLWLQDSPRGSLLTGLPAISLSGAAIHAPGACAATGLYLLPSPVELRVK